MGEMTLEELQRRVEEQRGKQLQRLKDKYQLAIELGFTPAEAQILRGKTEEEIKRLALEKESIKLAVKNIQ
jgi:hypothetical protein